MVIGNCTRDPEVRSTATGQNVASFGVASNRRWKDQATGQPKEEVEFHNVVAWGKLAEIVGQYLARGRRVYVEGRLKTREWDGQDGVRRNRTEIIAENVIMLDRPTGVAGPAAGRVEAGNREQGAGGLSPAPALSVPPPLEDEIKMEEIPF